MCVSLAPTNQAGKINPEEVIIPDQKPMSPSGDKEIEDFREIKLI